MVKLPRAKLDDGADVSCISERYLLSLGLSYTPHAPSPIRGVGSLVKRKGVARLHFRMGGSFSEFSWDFTVLDDGEPNSPVLLLGLDFRKAYRVICDPSYSTVSWDLPHLASEKLYTSLLEMVWHDKKCGPPWAIANPAEAQALRSQSSIKQGNVTRDGGR